MFQTYFFVRWFNFYGFLKLCGCLMCVCVRCACILLRCKSICVNVNSILAFFALKFGRKKCPCILWCRCYFLTRISLSSLAQMNYAKAIFAYEYNVHFNREGIGCRVGCIKMEWMYSFVGHASRWISMKSHKMCRFSLHKPFSHTMSTEQTLLDSHLWGLHGIFEQFENYPGTRQVV